MVIINLNVHFLWNKVHGNRCSNLGENSLKIGINFIAFHNLAIKWMCSNVVMRSWSLQKPLAGRSVQTIQRSTQYMRYMSLAYHFFCTAHRFAVSHALWFLRWRWLFSETLITIWIWKSSVVWFSISLWLVQRSYCTSLVSTWTNA